MQDPAVHDAEELCLLHCSLQDGSSSVSISGNIKWELHGPDGECNGCQCPGGEYKGIMNSTEVANQDLGPTIGLTL